MIRKLTDLLNGKASLREKRSSHWPKIRRNHLEKNPTCAVCGGTEKIEVHHIVPFNKNHSLELEPTNLITLCESKLKGINCHLFIGHLGSFKKENPEVVKDAKVWFDKLLAAQSKSE